MLIQGIIFQKPLLLEMLGKKLGVQLIVGSVQEAIDTGRAKKKQAQMPLEMHYKLSLC